MEMRLAIAAGSLALCLLHGCHGELARLKPRHRASPGFYVVVARARHGGLFVGWRRQLLRAYY